MNRVSIIDTTLRDGSHAVHHQYTPQQVAAICSCLEASGVYAAEVGHGAGIGGSILQYGLSKHSDEELLTAARKSLKNTKLGTLVVPGLGTIEDIKAGQELGLDMIRVAVLCTEVDVGAQHIRLGKKLGLETAAFLMMSHLVSAEELADYGKMAESYGADILIFADSAGAMTLEDIRLRVEKLLAAVNIPIGVHAHNNLGLGVGNAVAAVESGAKYIDATLEGIGAGSGNTNLQALVAVLDKMHIYTGVDMYELTNHSGKFVRPLIQTPIEVTNESIILGKSGVYSSFYIPVKDAAKKFNISPSMIFEELGKRKVVGGQEDQIIDICYAIAENRN